VQTTAVERIHHAEAFFAAIKAGFRYRGDRAYYSAEGDYIQMPVIEAFRDAESFYATLAHESTHWTLWRLDSLKISLASSAKRTEQAEGTGSGD